MKSIKLNTKTKQSLARMCVIAVYAFGSRVQNTAHAGSDLDLGIVVKNPQRAFNDFLEFNHRIYSVLSEVFPDNLKLDISYLQTANPALGMAAVRYGRVIFETDPRLRADFEEELFKRYLEYQPLQRAYEEANFAAFV